MIFIASLPGRIATTSFRSAWKLSTRFRKTPSTASFTLTIISSQIPYPTGLSATAKRKRKRKRGLVCDILCFLTGHWLGLTKKWSPPKLQVYSGIRSAYTETQCATPGVWVWGKWNCGHVFVDLAELWISHHSVYDYPVSPRFEEAHVFQHQFESMVVAGLSDPTWQAL